MVITVSSHTFSIITIISIFVGPDVKGPKIDLLVFYYAEDVGIIWIIFIFQKY